MSCLFSVFSLCTAMRSTITTSTVQPPITKVATSETKHSLNTSKDQNDFFWSYTEEPHRTRRQAIIKAHPEVSCLGSFRGHSSTKFVVGHQTLRARAIDKVHRLRCRSPSTSLRSMAPKHSYVLSSFLPDRLHRWRNREPKSLPRHPRNLPQPSLSLSSR